MFFEEYNGEMRIHPENQNECDGLDCKKCSMESSCVHRNDNIHNNDSLLDDVIKDLDYGKLLEKFRGKNE